MTPIATAASVLRNAQEIQAFQVGYGVSPEFRTLAEDGDLSELLVSASSFSDADVILDIAIAVSRVFSKLCEDFCLSRRIEF